MIKIEYSKQFRKSFKQRVAKSKNLLNRYRVSTKLFVKDRTFPILRDHELKGKKIGLRAFSIGEDLRVIYKEEVDGVIIFMDIGTHNQVY